MHSVPGFLCVGHITGETGMGPRECSDPLLHVPAMFAFLFEEYGPEALIDLVKSMLGLARYSVLGLDDDLLPKFARDGEEDCWLFGCF